MLQHSNHSVNAIRQSLENLLKSIYKSNLKILKFIIDSQYKLCYFITKNLKVTSMSKESTSGMISQRAAGGGKQYGVPYGMGFETPGERNSK